MSGFRIPLPRQHGALAGRRARASPSPDAAPARRLASALLLVPALLLVTPIGDGISLPARKLQWHATR